MAQIGTVRLQTQNNGTVSVPVFDVGDSGSDVYEFVRVQTAGGTGFIPVVAPSSASFPYLRVQSQNQGVVAVHNESSLFPKTVDNFEAEFYEDQNNTLSDYYSGDLGVFNRVTSPTNSGSWALEHDTTNNNSYVIYADEGTAPNEVPKKGNTFEFYLRPEALLQTTSVDYALRFGVNGARNEGYELEFNDGGQGNTADQDIRLRTFSASSIDSATGIGFTTQWYRIEIDWGTDDNLVATVFNSDGSQKTQLSITDAEGAGNTSYGFRIRTIQSVQKKCQWDDVTILS